MNKDICELLVCFRSIYFVYEVTCSGLLHGNSAGYCFFNDQSKKFLVRNMVQFMQFLNDLVYFGAEEKPVFYSTGVIV
jgi:hypothetical protein